MKNTIIWNSFGYDMTINQYAKIVSDTPKTVRAVPVARLVTNDNGMGAGRSIPRPDKVTGEPFIAYKRWADDGELYFAGQGKRWYIWEKKPNYFNTWD